MRNYNIILKGIETIWCQCKLNVIKISNFNLDKIYFVLKQLYYVKEMSYFIICFVVISVFVV